jgi:hypothetical protein
VLLDEEHSGEYGKKLFPMFFLLIVLPKPLVLPFIAGSCHQQTQTFFPNTNQICFKGLMVEK